MRVSAQSDKKGIEFSSDIQHDFIAQFLLIPSNPQDDNFTMANTIPAIDFAIQQGLVPWDESDNSGRKLSDGLYMIQIRQNNYTNSKTVMFRQY